MFSLRSLCRLPHSSTQFSRLVLPSVTRQFCEAGSHPPGTAPYFNDILEKNKVVVFMKGTPDAPRCGFSNAVVQILRMHGVKYDSHDVLADDSVRQGIKEFSSWPTIPQVYINKEFVGGCDILLQMHQNGELIEELRKNGILSELLKKEIDEVREE